MRQARLERFGVDPLKRLRRLRGDYAPEPSDLQKAVRRILASPDGKMLANWMFAQSYGRTVIADAPDSALREMEARKRFFDQILALAEEPSESAQPSASKKS